MFKKSSKGYYFWEEFTEVDGIVHGFSTRKFGDMNIKRADSDDHLKVFLRSVGIDNKNVIRMNQVHGNKVSLVSATDSGKIIDKTDGLISSQRNIFLVATFADCTPVLFLDKEKKIFGIAHVGWKGVYREIVRAMVSKIIDYGSNTQNILVGIGPSIRVCCYNVENDRTMMFKNKFPKWQNKILEKRSNKVFLDLQTHINFQLLKSGVLSKNIKDSKICTKDNVSDFYSFRVEHGKSSFGLSAAVIGRI